ncbi:hypothetical protein S40293_07413 [Stachybotrys chartarum IBT 40293]|nr:hypothetical protein S40293_07413 [Stachybotrys chartarum IBT 40293]
MIRSTQRPLTGLSRHLRPFTNSHLGLAILPVILARNASLSAIHRGMRRSDRATNGGAGFSDKFAERRVAGPSRNSTRKAIDGAGSMRQRQKLRKKLERKMDEDEEDAGPRSRRKRFVDPDSPFGKSSLVYRLKYGDLKELADRVPIRKPEEPPPFRRLEPRRTPREQTEKPYPAERTGRRGEESRPAMRNGEKQDRPRRNDRQSESPFHKTRGTAQSRTGWRDGEGNDGSRVRERRSEPPSRNNQRTETSRPPRTDQSRRDQDGESHEREEKPARKRSMMPMTIKYTTAASQFLYGRSVVQAALQQGRRKLYNLYIQEGENQKHSKEDSQITRLATAQGIPVTAVPKDDQRLMDKMSMGRPHNGFVLEASPLPQLPVASLGKLDVEAGKAGFRVELNHQTKEEEAINGADTFVPRSSGTKRKPFVLLLHEILDPGNLGGLLRTASYLGADAVGITTRTSSTLTPVVLKSAAGAVEEVTIFNIDSPIEFIEESRKAGWKTYAAVAPPDYKLLQRHGGKFISTDTVETTSPLDSDPCILVLGNEGHGLPKPVKVAADYELSVPRFVANSSVDSLNVSVAAGLLCHAFMRERVRVPGGHAEEESEQLF